MRGHEARINALAFGSDGRWLATASNDTTVRLWDLVSGDPFVAPLALTDHKEQQWIAATSPDDRWLVTCSWEGVSSVWDVAAVNPAAAVTILEAQTISTASVATAVGLSPNSHLYVYHGNVCFAPTGTKTTQNR